jgi:propionyl-CoA synthetase
VKGRGEQPAIIYDSPLTGQKRTLTYHRLQVETQVLAAILRNFGIEKGDRPEARQFRHSFLPNQDRL